MSGSVTERLNTSLYSLEWLAIKLQQRSPLTDPLLFSVFRKTRQNPVENRTAHFTASSSFPSFSLASATLSAIDSQMARLQQHPAVSMATTASSAPHVRTSARCRSPQWSNQAKRSVNSFGAYLVRFRMPHGENAVILTWCFKNTVRMCVVFTAAVN